MSRATSEATGCQDQATTHSVLPQWPPGQQANKHQSRNDSKKVAKLMAMAMRRYITVHIAQQRRFRAFKNPTKRHHWVSIMADNDNWSRMCRFFMSFFIVDSYKKVAG
jgi:hypothetical protein